MNPSELHVVTGAFGYLGKYITTLLLEQGIRVRTLTGHPQRPHPFGDRVAAVPFHFDDPAALADDLRGASVVYNTYWVRFNYGQTSYDQAVVNSRRLTQAAVEAGVPRFVHISITNPSADSPLPYFRGKAELEKALVESGLSYAILRPTVLFGAEDILINNIAWLLRRSPVFGIFGSGRYALQPVYVGDAARLCVEMGRRRDNVIMDAVGPETYPFKELVALVKKRIGSRSLILPIPAWLGLLTGRLIGPLVGDVLITREEIEGLRAGLLVSGKPPTCPTRFSDWVSEHAAELGRTYASELARHFR